MNNLNPLFEISTQHLYKGIRNGLLDRGRTMAALKLGGAEYGRSIRPSNVLSNKIVSKSEAQLQRLFNRLNKQNGGNIEKSKSDWNNIWNKIHGEINAPTPDLGLGHIGEEISIASNKRDLNRIVDAIGNIERKYNPKDII